MENLERTASVGAALSDPLRLQILDLMHKGRNEMCVSFPNANFPNAICPYLDVLPQLDGCSTSKLSYHLKILRKADLVNEHRSGKLVFYLVNVETLETFLERMQTWLSGSSYLK